jgi:hypothetical protein
LADQAVQAGGPGLSWAAFISEALRDLSVALCQGNQSLCWSGAYVTTRALAWPSIEVVWAYFAPCVTVWGFFFRLLIELRGLALCPVRGCTEFCFWLEGLFFHFFLKTKTSQTNIVSIKPIFLLRVFVRSGGQSLGWKVA